MSLANNININESYLFFEDKKLLGFSQEAIKYIQEQAQKILELENENSKLEKKAYYDELTGLLNRHGLKEEIEKYFSKGEKISVISVDIEKLKMINEYYGSNSGDEAIKNTADILNTFFRIEERDNKKDLICRWGGDEFLILLNRVEQSILEKRIGHILTAVQKISHANINEKKYPYQLHISLINDYIIDDYRIANEKGLLEAKKKMKEFK